MLNVNLKIETMKENRLQDAQNIFKPVNEIKVSGNECDQREDGTTCSIRNSFVAECNRMKYLLIKNLFLCNGIDYLEIVFVNTVERRLSGPRPNPLIKNLDT